MLPRAESREVMKMLRLLQLAYKEISRESREGSAGTAVLEGEQNIEDDTRMEILFDKLVQYPHTCSLIGHIICDHIMVDSSGIGL